jgi:hypothetical protein
VSGELLVRSPSMLWRNVGEHVVLAPPGRGDFEELSPTAAAAWRLLEAPRTLPELTDALAATYRMPREDVADDIRKLVEDLVDREAIEMVADADD